MTTHRPTGADIPRPADEGGAEWMLPDEATLNRLAGEFFSALPSGSAGLPAAPVGVSVAQPDVPTSPPNVGVPSPSHAATSAGPQEVSGAAPHRPDASAPMPTTAGAPGFAAVPDVRTMVPSSGVTGVSGTPSGGKGDPTVPGPTPSGTQGLSGGTPPGGPTPEPTVPSWGREVPMAEATSVPTQPDGVHYDPFFTTLPSLRDVLSPSRFPEAAAPAAGEPSFYFLNSPGAVAAGRRPDAHPPFDVNAVRNDFPILRERVNGHPLVWFDNAATTQKPRSVIERLAHFYEHENSNIHRAAHELAARSTDAYEQARNTVARFIGASSPEEIIFVRGATEGINLIAQTWGRKNIREGDEIIISHLEHHANIVPWQMLAGETGAVLKVIPVDDNGELLLGEYTKLLSDRTKLVSVTQVSNALGTLTPVQEIVAEAQRAGAVTVIDGAQSVPHTRIDVRSIGADFFVFSGHKLFGPTGIGVVYGKSEILQDVPPWQGGGNMISDVTLERSIFQPPPGRFEAGTGNIADAVGLGTAIEYIERIGIDNIARYEHELLEYATPLVANVPGVRLVGTAPNKASVLSFVMAGYEPIEVGKALNEKGIAVRAGHHCAQPILRRLGLEATVRPSFAFYNTCAEIDRMVAVLEQLAVRTPR
ncbi:family 2A encapsulin nanocompartment cargo protein cysteine desulfurase [Nocardia sp. NPDC049149]|uniref:family 2A encapsulin nanocompartment cargo protein cysteine desulfurase n=1 Tax=Nocardia sp. NPDC049149 TaxID=3364315 RepID=UPI003718C386